MSDIQKKENEVWLRGYKAGARCAHDAVERAVRENPNIALHQLLIKIKVAVMTRENEYKD